MHNKSQRMFVSMTEYTFLYTIGAIDHALKDIIRLMAPFNNEDM